MRTIYIIRHGESVNNTLDIIGGNCNLTENGRKYAFSIGKKFRSMSQIPEVWTSNLKRTIETAECIGLPYKKWSGLNEISSGLYEGMKIEDIKRNFYKEYTARNSDKLNNMYPLGENYKMLADRVITVLDNIDMLSNVPLLIICHKAVGRVVYSYLTKTKIEDCVNRKNDLHKITKLYVSKL